MLLNIQLWCLLFPIMSFGPTAADGPEQMYKSLFGEEDRKVRLSGDLRDDVEFAAKLLKSAKTVPDSPKLQALLCDKAHEFGLKNKLGYATALEATTLLAQADPARKLDAQEKALEVRQLQYKYSRGQERLTTGRELVDALMSVADAKLKAKQAGDAVALYQSASRVARYLRLRDEYLKIAGLIEVASAQDAKEKRIVRLENLVKANPKDSVAARNLLMAYLVDENNPAKAAALLDAADADQVLRTYLPMATKSIIDLPEGGCLEVAKWYQSLATDASPEARPVMLYNAMTYLERFLELHTTADADHLKAKMQAAAILKEIKSVKFGEEVTIPANSEEGYVIGPVGRGSRMTLSYVSGKWKDWGSIASVCPDTVVKDRNRLVIASYDDAAKSSTRLVIVPTGTQAKPFTYVFRKGHKKVVLRIFDGMRGYADNPGKVVYRVSLTPQP